MSSSNPFDQYAPAGGSFRGMLYDGEDADLSSVCTVDNMSEAAGGFQGGQSAVARRIHKQEHAETLSDDNEDVKQFHALTDNHDDNDDGSSGSSRNDHEDIGSILTEEYSMDRYPPSPSDMSFATGAQQQQAHPREHQEAIQNHISHVMVHQSSSHDHPDHDDDVQSEYTIEFYSEEDEERGNVVKNQQKHATYITTNDNDDKHDSPVGKSNSSIFSPRQVWLTRKRRFLIVLMIMAALAAAAVGISLALKNTDGVDDSSSSTKAVIPQVPIVGAGEETTAIVHYKAFESRSELEVAVDLYLETSIHNQDDDKAENNAVVVVDPATLTKVSKTYGYPIGSWKLTSNITDLSFLFSATRNPNAAWFNEPLDDW